MWFVFALVLGASSQELRGQRRLADTLYIDGLKYSGRKVEEGAVEVQFATYIVKVSDQEKKVSLLEELAQEHQWTPKTNFMSTPMFAGEMGKDLVVWLLARPEVDFVEKDAQIRLDDPVEEHPAESPGKKHAPTKGGGTRGQTKRGVSIDGKLYTAEDIEGGVVEIATGDFIVGVQANTKTALLDEMQRILKWEPKMHFSESLPMFSGRLTPQQIVWLLNRNEVSFIENDGKVHAFELGKLSTQGPPQGVRINGELYKTEDIESGDVEISKGSFIVGVAKEAKALLLEVMKQKLDWHPTFAYSDAMPLFAGVMTQDEILWLLSRREVVYIENDGTVHASRKGLTTAKKGKGGGETVHGLLRGPEDIAKSDLASDSYIIGVAKGEKKELLKLMERELEWKPTTEYSEAMPLFAGRLSKVELMWLMHRKEVTYIELDGPVFVAAKGRKLQQSAPPPTLI